MDDELRAYLLDMEERLIREFQLFTRAAYALHQRVVALEAAAAQLGSYIERLLERVEDPAESHRRR